MPSAIGEAMSAGCRADLMGVKRAQTDAQCRHARRRGDHLHRGASPVGQRRGQGEFGLQRHLRINVQRRRLPLAPPAAGCAVRLCWRGHAGSASWPDARGLRWRRSTARDCRWQAVRDRHRHGDAVGDKGFWRRHDRRRTRGRASPPADTRSADAVSQISIERKCDRLGYPDGRASDRRQLKSPSRHPQVQATDAGRICRSAAAPSRSPIADGWPQPVVSGLGIGHRCCGRRWLPSVRPGSAIADTDCRFVGWWLREAGKCAWRVVTHPLQRRLLR